jgi:7-carboxy-7-deazaguanine synthase
MEKRYQVKSVWKTLQGEGLFAGRPAVFVRMVGCNLWSGYQDTRRRDAERNGAACPLWCDTDFTREGSQSYQAQELAQYIRRIGEGISFCVITGGEPLLQLDASLMEVLHAEGFFVAIETNGTLKLEDSFSTSSGNLLPPDWIVCSPKLPQEQLKLEYFDELKLVIPDYPPASYSGFLQRQRQHRVQGNVLPLLWLQPEDGDRLRQATLSAIGLSLSNPQWRVSVQTHKILGVD